MPKKKIEEESAVEQTTAETSTKENTVDEAADENSVVSDNIETTSETEENVAEASAETATEETSAITSVAETVGSAIGSVAAKISEGISSVAASITGDSPATEPDKSHHNKRAERIGIVQSDKMTKTVTVRVERQVKHPIYRKYIKRRKNFMAHDEQGAAIGDKVRIVETRPMSAKKRWRVIEIIQKAVK